MEVKNIDNKETWENFLSQCQEKTFLQSWNWGEFCRAMDEKIWRLGISAENLNLKSKIENLQLKSKNSENETLIAVAQVVKVKARRGRFLLIPHGPITKVQSSKFKVQSLRILLAELKKIAKQEKCAFIRIAPVWERQKENEKPFKDLGFRPAPLHIHPELTWELNLEPSEQELLAGMRKTTRYLIMQGLKNPELQIEKSQNPKDIEILNSLYQKTVERHHFVPFSLEYLKNEFLAFLPENQVLIFVAKYKGGYVAAAIIIFWQGIAFYHQGASCEQYPKIPASYLLQWEAIKEAKRRGCKVYNFWGIAPVFTPAKMGNPKSETRNPKQILNSKSQILNPKHPWMGLTLFKTGFGGYARAYVRTQDLPLSSRYWFAYLVEKIRKARRGFGF